MVQDKLWTQNRKQATLTASEASYLIRSWVFVWIFIQIYAWIFNKIHNASYIYSSLKFIFTNAITQTVCQLANVNWVFHFVILKQWILLTALSDTSQTVLSTRKWLIPATEHIGMLIFCTDVIVIYINRIIKETNCKQDLRIQLDKDTFTDYERPPCYPFCRSTYGHGKNY